MTALLSHAALCPDDLRQVVAEAIVRACPDRFMRDSQAYPAADAIHALYAPLIAEAGEWRPIETAPKDGSTIWAVFYGDIYPRLKPGREDLESWNGRQVPLRHPGIFPSRDGSPFDVGWNVAAPVGNGGFPDDWIAGWRPLPSPPAAIRSSASEGGRDE